MKHLETSTIESKILGIEYSSLPIKLVSFLYDLQVRGQWPLEMLSALYDGSRCHKIRQVVNWTANK